MLSRTLQHAYFRPAAPLDGYVDYIQVSLSSPDRDDPVTVTTLVRPYCRLTVKLGGPVYRRRASGTSRTPSRGLIGINETPYQAIAYGDIFVVLVGFKPWAVRCFFDVDIAGLRDGMLSLRQFPGLAVEGADGDRPMPADDQSGRGVEEVVDSVQACLRARLVPERRDQAVERAVSMIVERDGAVRVDDIARACWMGTRQLRRRFGRAVGTGPKAFARIIRFHRALALASEERDWTRVAFRAGYADLPHLDREFRAFANDSPTGMVHAGSPPANTAADTLERNRWSSALDGR